LVKFAPAAAIKQWSLHKNNILLEK